MKKIVLFACLALSLNSQAQLLGKLKEKVGGKSKLELYPEEKLDITYEDGVLHVKGRSEESEEEKRKNVVIHRMQRISSFDYGTYLPRPIDESKIEATVKNGVLTVTAPIAEAAKAKKIQVKKS